MMNENEIEQLAQAMKNMTPAELRALTATVGPESDHFRGTAKMFREGCPQYGHPSRVRRLRVPVMTSVALRPSGVEGCASDAPPSGRISNVTVHWSRIDMISA